MEGGCHFVSLPKKIQQYVFSLIFYPLQQGEILKNPYADLANYGWCLGGYSGTADIFL